MTCVTCPYCGRRHALHAPSPQDDEAGGRCVCGARFVVRSRLDDEAERGEAAGHPGTEPPPGARATWLVDDDGSAWEVEFF